MSTFFIEIHGEERDGFIAKFTAFLVRGLLLEVAML